jgi:hypothetical protein
VARLLAEGNDDIAVGFISGYTPQYIRMLKKNPAFLELLGYYENNREEIFVDVAKRMADLGVVTLEELQRRLEETPDDWTRRELMELADLLVIRGKQGTSGAVLAPAGGVQLNINFVKESPTTIDVTPEK